MHMADQKAGPKQGFVFIPPPTAEQLEAARRGHAKTLVMHVAPARLPTEGSSAPKTATQEPIRSLKKTQLGLPIVAPPAHKEEKINFTEVWASLGLPKARKHEPEAEKPKQEEIFDRLLGLRRSTDPRNVEMLDFTILQMEGEFRSLIKSEKLQPICSGGRAFLDAEKPIAESIGKIQDEIARKFEHEPGLEAFLRQFVEEVLSSAPLTESEGKSESEMRNGFYRAVAWCLCTHNDHKQFIKFISRNHVSLIDGVGIAAGVSTSDFLGDDFSKDIIAILLDKKWVSLAFYHLQDMIRKDLAGMRKAQGSDAEDYGEAVRAKMDAFLMVLFREVERYQTLGQKYTHLAMLLSNLSQNRNAEVPVMYIASSEFYSLVTTRQMGDSRVWSDLGHTHKFIAERMADKEDGKKQYVVGLRPKDIAQRFFTILEGIDFLTSDKTINSLALEMIADLHAPFSQDQNRNEAFKKVVSLALFTDKEDLKAHAKLFGSLCDSRDPIISLRASEHAEMLLKRKASTAHNSINPFENLGDDSPF